MKKIFKNNELKVIVDFCKMTKSYPKSLLEDKLLKENVKDYFRFPKEALSNSENELFGKKSPEWVKRHFKDEKTIVAIFHDGKFVHSCLYQDEIFEDVAGRTGNLDDILSDFGLEKHYSFTFYSDLESFFEIFQKNS